MFGEKLFKLDLSTKVLLGKGQLSEVGRVSALFGSRVFLLTMKQLTSLGFAEKIKAVLKEAELEVTVFDEVEAEPTCTHVDEVAKKIVSAKAELLVALGGGSVIDVAKAAAIRATHDQPTWMYVNLSNRLPLAIESRVLPVIAVPTTSGTGSEVTPYSVMTNNETKQKGTIKSSEIFPKYAIVDPELTASMPRELTAASGIDAFAHALESYLNKSNRTPFSDMVAAQAMNILYNTLPKVIENGGNINLRAETAWASTLAGIAIANAGTTVAHAMAQPLGARAHVPHSLSVAIFLPAVVRHSWKADSERFAKIASILDAEKVAGLSEGDKAKAAVEMIERLLHKVGMSHKISEYDKTEGLVDLLTEDVTTYMSRPLAQHNPDFNKEDVHRIIKESC